MTYEMFLKVIPAMVKKRMGEEADVSLHTVYKNNNVKQEALCILEKGSNVSPTIYLRPYYEIMEEDDDLEGIVDSIMVLYRNNCGGMYLDVDEFRNFDQVRSRIVYKVVNYERNQELLKDVPYRRFLDLAVVYYFLIDNHFLGSGTAMIHNHQMETWGVEEKDLYALAAENTERLLGCEITPLNDVIRDLLKQDLLHQLSASSREDITREQAEDFAHQIMDCLMPQQNYSMFVLSNHSKYFGASAVLNHQRLSDFAMEHKCNFYVVPSSIHEVILMPQTEPLSAKELQRLLEDINREGENGQEFLSERIYYFDREKDCLKM